MDVGMWILLLKFPHPGGHITSECAAAGHDLPVTLCFPGNLLKFFQELTGMNNDLVLILGKIWTSFTENLKLNYYSLINWYFVIIGDFILHICWIVGTFHICFYCTADLLCTDLKTLLHSQLIGNEWILSRILFRNDGLKSCPLLFTFYN